MAIIKRLKIGVDVDGVLANFTDAAKELIRELFNKDVKGVTQTTWSFSSLGLSDTDEDKIWRHIDSSVKDFWYNFLYPMPDTNLLKPLCDAHEVIFITNRKHPLPEAQSMPVNEQTAYWLRNWFHIPNPTVLLSNKKGPLAKALGLDYFIDDRDKNLQEVIAEIGAGKVIGLEATYTPAEFRKSHPNWVHNFNQFARFILEYPNTPLRWAGKTLTYSVKTGPGVCIA